MRMKTCLVTSIISYVLITYALILIYMTPATDYEASIYLFTPIGFWIAIFAGIGNGIFLLTTKRYKETNKLWLIGLFEIILCNFLVISLYALRGYKIYFWRGDISTYIGLIQDIILYGTFFDNMYPIISILLAQIYLVTEIPPIKFCIFIPAFFSILYMLFIYIWGRSFALGWEFLRYMIISGIPIFFAWFSTSIYHQFLSIMLLPLLFYLLQQNKHNLSYQLLTIILLIAFPFIHPITSTIIILYLIIIFVLQQVMDFGDYLSVSFTLLMIAIVSSFAWFINQYILLKSLSNIIAQIVQLQNAPTTLAESQNYLYNLGEVAIAKALIILTLDEFIYYILTFYLLWHVLINKKCKHSWIYSTYICFIIGSIFLLLMFVSSRTHTVDRLINLNFNMILAIPLVSYLLYCLHEEKKHLAIVIIISLIVISSISAILSLYPHSLTMRPNEQGMNSDIVGIDWIIINKDTNLDIATLATPINRISELIYGRNYGLSRKDLLNKFMIPDHFGSCPDEFVVDADMYLVITELDKVSYTDTWKNMGRFKYDDFLKLDNMYNMGKIYNNGPLLSYLVQLKNNDPIILNEA